MSIRRRASARLFLWRDAARIATPRQGGSMSATMVAAAESKRISELIESADRAQANGRGADAAAAHRGGARAGALRPARAERPRAPGAARERSRERASAPRAGRGAGTARARAVAQSGAVPAHAGRHGRRTHRARSGAGAAAALLPGPAAKGDVARAPGETETGGPSLQFLPALSAAARAAAAPASSRPSNTPSAS